MFSKYNKPVCEMCKKNHGAHTVRCCVSREIEDICLLKAVAVEIMGWVCVDDEQATTSCFVKYEVDGDERWWDPILDINHASLVIEKMRDLGFTITINTEDGAREYYTEFYSENYGSQPGETGCDMFMGRSICWAALDAVRRNKSAMDANKNKAVAN